jgi:hypothetical protein
MISLLMMSLVGADNVITVDKDGDGGYSYYRSRLRRWRSK